MGEWDAANRPILDIYNLEHRLEVVQQEADDANEACSILYGALVGVIETLKEGMMDDALQMAQDALEMVEGRLNE